MREAIIKKVFTVITSVLITLAVIQLMAVPAFAASLTGVTNTLTDSTAGATIAHGLGAVPKMIWIKNLDIADDWQVYHVGMGNTKYLILNTTAIAGTATTRWNDTSPTSTLTTV